MVGAGYEQENVHQQLADDYSFFYEYSMSDSPKESRRQLIDRVLHAAEGRLKTQDTVYILDMGAGRQVLEYEMQFHPLYKKIRNNLKIISLDIARLTDKQLLTYEDEKEQASRAQAGITIDQHQHVRANGAMLPFASGIFDMVISSMAIDFMPREDTFQEVARVLKPDAEILINFHHPDLIEKAQNSYYDVKHQLHSAKKNVQHGRNSRRYAQNQEHLKKMEQQKADLLFILNEFPSLIFHKSESILEFLAYAFPNSRISIEEFTKLQTNGWFAATVLLGISATEIWEEPQGADAAD